MSIEDQDGNSIVTLGAIHAAVFRFVIWAAALAIPGGVLATFHMLRTVDNHEWRLRLLERESGSGQGVSQSVNVGAVEKVAESAREYLTVQEVAEREGVTARTILNWIEEERLFPLPEKPGKEWVISDSYRILPQMAATGRKADPEPAAKPN